MGVCARTHKRTRLCTVVHDLSLIVLACAGCDMSWRPPSLAEPRLLERARGTLPSPMLHRRKRGLMRILQLSPVAKCNAPDERCPGVTGKPDNPIITDTCVDESACYITPKINGCGEKFAGLPLAPTLPTLLMLLRLPFVFALSRSRQNVCELCSRLFCRPKWQGLRKV